MTMWAVTKIEHVVHGALYDEQCADCLALADSAITMAAVTGSVGATFVVEKAGGAVEHSCTVERAIAVIHR